MAAYSICDMSLYSNHILVAICEKTVYISSVSKSEKLIKRFRTRPGDFTFQELRKLLSFLGYEEFQKGKTSGSRVAFINKNDKHIIRLHKLHPDNVLKRYQIDQIMDELNTRGLI